MKRTRIITLVLVLILGLTSYLISHKIELPSFGWAIIFIVVIAGIILFLKKTYFRFESKRIFVYASLGLTFIFSSYIISSLFLKKNPLIVMPLLMLLTLLSIIFLGLAAYKSFKDSDKYKKWIYVVARRRRQLRKEL